MPTRNSFLAILRLQLGYLHVDCPLLAYSTFQDVPLFIGHLNLAPVVVAAAAAFVHRALEYAPVVVAAAGTRAAAWPTGTGLIG